MQIRVEEYVQPSGLCPFREWFCRLPPSYAAKVSVALLRLVQGNTANIKWFDGLGELRIDWGPGVRIYLAQDGSQLVILFGGGTKASQAKDIVRAAALLDEYKARKKQKPKR